MIRLPNLLYVSVIQPGYNSERNAILLAESIRAFAGNMSHYPIWFLTPNKIQLSKSVMNRLERLSVEVMPYKPLNDDFFFLNEVHAAAFAEKKALQHTQLIAWLGSNSLILKEPKDFLLNDGKNLGYRPVHHTLVGSKYHEPIDGFWTEINKFCKVHPDKIFQMKTHVDGQIIRPYFNAGFIISRPEKKLFKIWDKKFRQAYRLPSFKKFLDNDQRYTIFLHQAILSGIILAYYQIYELFELPGTYNYPIHLFNEDITETKPNKIDALTTIRHEGFYTNPNWENEFYAEENLKKWLKRVLT